MIYVIGSLIIALGFMFSVGVIASMLRAYREQIIAALTYQAPLAAAPQTTRAFQVMSPPMRNAVTSARTAPAV